MTSWSSWSGMCLVPALKVLCPGKPFMPSKLGQLVTHTGGKYLTYAAVLPNTSGPIILHSTPYPPSLNLSPSFPSLTLSSGIKKQPEGNFANLSLFGLQPYLALQIPVFYKLKVCGNPAPSKSVGAILPTASAHFMFLCHAW